MESFSLNPKENLLQLASFLKRDRLVYLRSLDMWSLRVLVCAQWFTLTFLNVRCCHCRESSVIRCCVGAEVSSVSLVATVVACLLQRGRGIPVPIFRFNWKCNCHERYQAKQAQCDGDPHAGREARP